jgi:hypothetical protein
MNGGSKESGEHDLDAGEAELRGEHAAIRKELDAIRKPVNDIRSAMRGLFPANPAKKGKSQAPSPRGFESSP